MKTIDEDLFGAKRAQLINQKQKGNRNELALAHLMTEWTGHEFVRVPRSGGLRWKNTVNICGDLISADPSFDFPYSVETKHLKDIGIAYGKVKSQFVYRPRANSVVFTLFEQAIIDASRSQKRPMLMLRYNGMPAKEYYMFVEQGDPLDLVDTAYHRIEMKNEDMQIRGYLFSDIRTLPFNMYWI